MKYEDFDYILLYNPINEDLAVDKRNYSRKLPSIDYNPRGMYIGVRDPKLMTSWNFGKQLQRNLNNLGAGFNCQVFDCGGEVAVTISHNQIDTGRTASKTFIIVFDNKSGDGIIKSSSTRWRTVSGLGQVESYIRSVASNLASDTQKNG